MKTSMPDLPTTHETPHPWTFFKRALRWRCPECGEAPVFKPLKETRNLDDWMHPLHGCPNCGYAYEREPGYFLLSIWAYNYGIVGAVGLAALFIIQDIYHLPNWQLICFVVPWIPVMNFLFIRHSKTLFLALDHYCDPHLKPVVADRS